MLKKILAIAGLAFLLAGAVFASDADEIVIAGETAQSAVVASDDGLHCC